MKRLIALGIGVFGLRALIRRRRSRTAHADELREKLAANRAAEPAPPVVPSEPEPEPEPAAPAVMAEKPKPKPKPAAPPRAKKPKPEPDAEPAPPETDSVDERRAEVHARARQKIDELS